MAGYIERDAVIRAVMAAKWVDGSDGAMAMEIVASQPAADVALVKRAHWIEQDGMQICSECGEEHTWDDFRAAYCDCCGAKIDGGAVDEP